MKKTCTEAYHHTVSETVFKASGVEKQATDKGTGIRMTSDFSAASLGRLSLRKLVANLESHTQPI